MFWLWGKILTRWRLLPAGPRSGSSPAVCPRSRAKPHKHQPNFHLRPEKTKLISRNCLFRTSVGKTKHQMFYWAPERKQLLTLSGFKLKILMNILLYFKINYYFSDVCFCLIPKESERKKDSAESRRRWNWAVKARQQMLNRAEW